MMLERFYLIVDSSDWLRRLLPCGVKLVQLRIKDATLEQVRAEILTAKALCAQAGAQLVVNDFWQLAIEASCDYVHLGQEDLAAADVPAIRRAGIRLGISTHDEEELGRALAYEPDYLALGPIYPTVLKAMRFAPQGLEKISQWKARIGSRPLVAIGGLTVENAPPVFAAGADSLCVVTDVLRSPNPLQRTRQWLHAAAGGYLPPKQP
jgi:thiamine-phosphate pyrophosphorylase